MTLNSKSNFAFLYNINPELYASFYEAECFARTNYRQCGRSIRDAMEKFVDGVIQAKRLAPIIPHMAMLNDKLKILQDVQALRSAGYLKPGQTLTDRPLLPRMEDVIVPLENGKKGKMDRMTFIRRFGNACSHPEIKPSNPKICFRNTADCLQSCQLLLQRYYKDRLPAKMNAFDEDLMPIDKYVVYESHVPADKERSKCVMEYLAYEPDEFGDPERYFLIREYDRKSSDSTFMLRNQTCFRTASSQTLDNVVEGMAQLREITPRNSTDSDQYLVSYIFNREPRPLSNRILQEMDIDQRMEMCGRIVKCLDNLHHSEIPIFHRLLSYESIYVCKFRGTWIPYIVKFDYAKIVTAKQIGTVFMSTVESQNYLRKQGREKYLPPEWVQISEGTAHADWAKVDVYSLGVLLCDILSGKISGRQVNLYDLEDMGVPDLVLEVLEGMLAESPSARCPMKEVREVFDCEMG